MLIALHVNMSGRVDRSAKPWANHQPRPLRIEARLYGIGMTLQGEVSGWVRPDDGWPVPEAVERETSNFGLPGKSIVSLVSLLNRCARHVLAHDIDETDHAMRVCRAIYRPREADWLRDTQVRIDTATEAAALMGMDGRLPTLEDATAEILGEPMSGVTGLLALHSAPPMQAIRRAA